MKRVPVDLVVLVLAQSGITVNPRQIRNWKLRGHITRTNEGYDLTEILAYIEGRSGATESTARLCSLDGCAEPHLALGYCIRHYRRYRRNGDPHDSGRPALVGYAAVHKRLRTQRGDAKQHTCGCGAQAAEWAYDHGDADELTTADGLPYSLDPRHYEPRCRPCHRQLDASHRASEVA